MMTKQAELKAQAYAGTLKSRALSVLIYLIDRSNKELTCFPAVSTMAEQLHISVSTVKRALHELIDTGYIRKEFRYREKSGGQTSNLYTLVLFEDETVPDNDSHDISGESVTHTELAEGLQGSGERQSESRVEYINFATIMKQKNEAEEMDMGKERDGRCEPIVHREEGQEKCACVCERGRGSFWYPLELPRLTGLEKRKSKYCYSMIAINLAGRKEVSIFENAIILLDEYDMLMWDAYVYRYWEEMSGFIRSMLCCGSPGFIVMPLGKYWLKWVTKQQGIFQFGGRRGVCWLGWGWIIVEICQ
jgi:hypothetical protein